ncbi:hypothetical protein Runsl_4446 [Runella slithyformis DSM 19594]|uniref:Uncharacterized protein n=1 Tax=Runella slithyformis (strain ATCC 29530 / DSM 19594 / LMG 11500 / NCIMB 11436 / LSU 4) TaxID=761193 RepID=A0A7U4E7K7_RUNSL|nr:hypothetical protein Runsl_4446 [Runella slithyformis DSM 19594]
MRASSTLFQTMGDLRQEGYKDDSCLFSIIILFLL